MPEPANSWTNLLRSEIKALVIVTTAHPHDEQRRADVVVDVESGRVVKNRFGSSYWAVNRCLPRGPDDDTASR